MSNLIRNIKIVNFVSNTSMFKLMFVLTILSSLIFSISNVKGPAGYIIVDFFCGSFGIVFMFMLFYFSSINAAKVFDNQKSIILREESKKRYLKNLLSIVSLTNLVLCLIVSLILTAFILFFKSPSLGIHPNYNIHMSLYLIFMFFKVYLTYNLISLVFIILYKKVNIIMGSIFPIINAMLLLLSNIELNENMIITDFKVNIAYFFLGHSLSYESFGMEFLNFAVVILIYVLIVIIVYEVCLNFKKDIISEKKVM